jgi:hypothetical protein
MKNSKPSSKKNSPKKPTKAPPSKISKTDYDKMTNSGYMFADRQMNTDAVRANQRANMYMTPSGGLAGFRTNPNKPPRPTNPNAAYRMNSEASKKKKKGK